MNSETRHWLEAQYYGGWCLREFRDFFATRPGAGYDSSSVFDVHRAVHRSISIFCFTVVLAYISQEMYRNTNLTILLAICFKTFE